MQVNVEDGQLFYRLYSATFGSGIRRSFSEAYTRAKEGIGIITALPEESQAMAPARKAARTGTQAPSVFSGHSEPAQAEAVNMQTIVSDWKANAERHDYRNFKFLRSLKWKCEREVDQAARQYHDKAFAIIDCIQCANCCNTITPVFLAKDIRRIAGHLGITDADFTARYLRRDEEGRLCAKSLPCLFLADDGRCKIYEVRPRDCAEYPHTRKKGFATRTYLHAGNALSCPAVFWIIRQLRATRLP